jgi:hypothetical protein
MLLTDVMKALDNLSVDQLRQLREYIQHREQQLDLKADTINLDELIAGLNEMRAGLTDEEYREIERAMNEEYIESPDDDP